MTGRVLLTLPLALLLAAGCRADREAAETVPETDPRIEEAPATPLPPMGVPTGAETVPDTAPPDTVNPDTMTTPRPEMEGS